MQIIPLTSDLSPSSKVLAQNTALCGLGVGFLFGPAAAIAAMVTNIAFSKLNDSSSEPLWLPIENRSIQKLKDYWKSGPDFFLLQIIYGIFFRILEIEQFAIVAIKQSIHSLSIVFFAYLRFSLIIPIVEGFVFRGFLQGKIRDIQVYVFGKETADSSVQKALRIGLQALIYGSCQLHAAEGILTFGLTVFTGGYLGYLKEEKKNLVESIGNHVHLNSAIGMRTCLFGA